MAAAKAAPSTPRRPSSATPVRRSRTGCLTCRQRKLKCDEQRPICGQCQKSHRECVQSEGVAWRHNQNAGRVDGDEKSLGSFFKYTNFFTDEQRRMFVPVPSQLVFVNVDPTMEESTSPPPQTPSTSDAQQVAAHSLEALSTAAAVGNTTSYPAQYYTSPQAGSYPEYTFIRPAEAGGDGQSSPVNHDITNALIIPRPAQSQTPNSLIDPSLEASVAVAVAQVEGDPEPEQSGEPISASMKLEGSDIVHEEESRVALALQKFNASS